MNCGYLNIDKSRYNETVLIVNKLIPNKIKCKFFEKYLKLWKKSNDTAPQFVLQKLLESGNIGLTEEDTVSRSIFSIFQIIIKFELIRIFECCKLDSLRIVKIDSKPNLDCNYTFPIDLEPNGISFHAKSIGKGELQSKFGLNETDLG